MASTKLYGIGKAPARFMETRDGFTGDKGVSGTPSSTISKKVQRCVANIKALAARDSKEPLTVAEQILTQCDDGLKKYIVSKRSVPKKSVKKRIVQAALLRMADIATIATVGLLNDTDAQGHIMEAETEAINMSHPDTSNILTYDAQAALSFVIDHIMETMQGVDIVDAVNKMQHAAAFGNNFNTGGTSKKMLRADNFDLGDLIPSSSAPAIGATVVSTPGAAPVSNPDDGDDSDDGESITDIIGGIVSGAGSISGIVKSTGQSLSGVGSDIGAQSISKYLQQYGLTIAIVILIIVFIIIIAARATN